MKRRKHNIIPLFFLLLTLAPLLFMGGLQAFQFCIKLRMEAALEEGALQTISLPATEVHWYEEGREILVDGKMFDIKTYSVLDGVFVAQGVFDEAETEVVKLLNGHWSEEQQTNTIVQLLLLSHCLILFAFYSIAFGITVFKRKLLASISSHYSSPQLTVIGPPPKCLITLS